MDIRPLSSREILRADQTQADVTHEITLRYFDGLTAKHRFKRGSRIFNIESLTNPDESEFEHVALCKEET